MSFKLKRPAPKSIHVTSPFGWRTSPISGKKSLHRGIDFGGKFTAIVSIDGSVAAIGYNPNKSSGFGQYVQIRFNALTAAGKKQKYRLTYAHGSHATGLHKGQAVKVGDKVFVTGATGAATGVHLHFQLEKWTAGLWKAIDPSPYF
jgi:murein DD-endopeptidase MepM/ murein hydrolase activator NlpD